MIAIVLLPALIVELLPWVMPTPFNAIALLVVVIFLLTVNKPDAVKSTEPEAVIAPLVVIAPVLPTTTLPPASLIPDIVNGDAVLVN